MVDTAPVRAVLADWGTSRLKLWAWHGGGSATFLGSDARGMKFLSPAGYPGVVAELLEMRGLPVGLPLLVCGMAGAAGGWHEAGYLPAPVPLSDLSAAVVRFDNDAREVVIVPGVSVLDPRPDVMRGEETQLIGLVGQGAPDLVCLPGTHSKWARLEGVTLLAFSTFMTGEVFEVIGTHSVLGRTLDETWNGAAFRAGVEAALKAPDAVWSALFSLRAGPILGQTEVAQGRARLSGLLIGAECGAARAAFGAGPIVLVASGAMASAYETALRMAGFAPDRRDAGDVTLRGLVRVAQDIWETS